MVRLRQWLTPRPMGLTPTLVRAVDTDAFHASYDQVFDVLRAVRWCDPSVITLFGDQRTIAQHLLMIADAPGQVAPGAQVPSVLKGVLSMGSEDEGSVTTIHAACAESPDVLQELLMMVVKKPILATFGIRRVESTIFEGELPQYTAAGFKMVSRKGATLDVAYDVPLSGGSKSKTMRSKRIRKTRRRNTKQ